MSMLFAIFLCVVGMTCLHVGFDLTVMQYIGIAATMWGYGIWLTIMNQSVLKKE